MYVLFISFAENKTDIVENKTFKQAIFNSLKGVLAQLAMLRLRRVSGEIT